MHPTDGDGPPSSEENAGLFWDCVLDRDDLRSDIVAARDRLADAARDARWSEVVALLDGNDQPFLSVNSVRVGGSSGFTPLHQAAWHGAEPQIVHELLDRGAWRSVRCTRGRTPAVVARAQGHETLADLLEVPGGDPTGRDVLDLEVYLAALMTVRTRMLGKTWRTPQLGPLLEFPTAHVWCPVPGMYGGFGYRWSDPEERTTLRVESWSRVAGGSGQRHHVTRDGVVLVEKGFV